MALKLTGDPAGIEALKQTSREYVKFLVSEAQTNFGNTAEFKDATSGKAYIMSFDKNTGEIDIQEKS